MTTGECDQNEVDFDLEQALAESWPAEQWQDVTVLLAVSGGADSVALLRAMAALKKQGSGQLIVAHFNHKTRGAASDEDERFVYELGQQLGLTCEVGRAQPNEAPACDEQTWRNQRYEFLQATAERTGARYIATAHTADDQAETILHRIIRGTGISGLGGIPRVRTLGHASLIRPILEVRREQLLGYLKKLKQDFRSDVSNEDCQFIRNRIRHELLPLLVSNYNPQVVSALLRLGRVASSAQEVIEEKVLEDLWNQCVHILHEGGVVLDCGQLRQATPFLIHELLLRAYRHQEWPLQAMGQTQWERLSEMILTAQDVQPIMLPGSIRAAREGEQLSLQRIESSGD